MDSVYSAGHYGSLLPNALNTSYPQYQVSSTSNVLSQFSSHLESAPLPPSTFFNYNNNIELQLPHSVAGNTPIMGSEAIVGRARNNLWTQPPPPPPPPILNSPFNGPLLTATSSFTNNSISTSSSYNSVTLDSSTTNDFRRIIQPPPPPPFLLAAKQNRVGINKIGNNISPVADDIGNTPTSSNQDLDIGLNKRSNFTGTVCELPENSRRPQVSEGRTFPLKVHGEYLRYDGMKSSEKDMHHYGGLPYQQNGSELDDDLERPIILTATKFVRKLPLPHSNTVTNIVNDPFNAKALTNTTLKKDTMFQMSPKSTESKSGRSSAEVIAEPVPGTSEERSVSNALILKRTASSGTLSRNGMSWRRRRSNDDASEKVDIPHLFVRKKGNFRLRRIKDQLFTEDSNECYEFAESGSCTSGVFCIYDHRGDASHRTAKICARLLKGRCRKTNCKYPHSLQLHQMPVCDYFIRRICTEENCQFLHVKHPDNAKPCDQFNRGICKLGDDCPYPHRYFRAVIIKRGQGAVQNDTWNCDAISDEDAEADDQVKKSNAILLWPI